MSKVRIAINGMGRIGRNMVRALYEGGYSDQIEVVAINDLGDVNINAHLLKYDTAHGRFGADVSVEDDCLVINGDRIRDFTERDPSKLPWGELGIDVVCECTGQFNSRDKAAVHLNAGAETREYQGGGYKDRFLAITIRCYVNEEDAQDALNILMEDIETVLEDNAQIEYVDKLNNTFKTQQITIISIDTDEGVLEPLGVGEILIEVRY